MCKLLCRGYNAYVLCNNDELFNLNDATTAVGKTVAALFSENNGFFMSVVSHDTPPTSPVVSLVVCTPGVITPQLSGDLTLGADATSCFYTLTP
jgi:hypothetical protein